MPHVSSMMTLSSPSSSGLVSLNTEILPLKLRQHGLPPIRLRPYGRPSIYGVRVAHSASDMRRTQERNMRSGFPESQNALERCLNPPVPRSTSKPCFSNGPVMGLHAFILFKIIFRIIPDGILPAPLSSRTSVYTSRTYIFNSPLVATSSS